MDAIVVVPPGYPNCALQVVTPEDAPVKNEVEVRVAVYEVGGEDVPPVDGPVLLVKSHWNCADMVVLYVEDQKSVTVSARNLIEAVRSATESRR